MQQDPERFLAEALQKTLQLVETIEDRYREVAFPIVLQSFIGTPEIHTALNGSNSDTNGFQTTESIYPSTMSVNEFFHLANPDSHPARFVTAAYYLFHIGKVEQFSQADILEIYRKLRQAIPKNPPDVLNQCIRKVHIIDASARDKQKCWTITSNGEKYVESLINDNGNHKNNNGNTISG